MGHLDKNQNWSIEGESCEICTKFNIHGQFKSKGRYSPEGTMHDTCGGFVMYHPGPKKLCPFKRNDTPETEASGGTER